VKARRRGSSYVVLTIIGVPERAEQLLTGFAAMAPHPRLKPRDGVWINWKACCKGSGFALSIT
jgi:hypothetical protein